MDEKLRNAIEDSHYLLAYCARVRIALSDSDRGKFVAYMHTLAAVYADVFSRDESLTGERIGEFWEAFIFVSNLASPATVEGMRYYFKYYYPPKPAPIETQAQDERPLWKSVIWAPFAKIVLPARGRNSPIGKYLFQSPDWFRSVTLIAACFAFFSSLASYTGRTTLVQYKNDLQYWTALVTLSRKPDVYAYQAQPESTETGYKLTPVDPEFPPLLLPSTDRLMRLYEAFPFAFRQSGKPTVSGFSNIEISCAALKNSQYSRATELAEKCSKNEIHLSNRDVYLAEELFYTVSRIDSERSILAWLAQPLAKFRALVTASADKSSGGSGPVFISAANATSGVNSVAAGERDLAAVRARPGQHSQFWLLLEIVSQHEPLPINLPPPEDELLGLEVRASLVMAVLNAYILPLFFGLLGACVHVLREIYRCLDSFSLTRSAFSRYASRLVLGMIAGPVIGFFFDTDGRMLGVSAGAQPATLTSHLPPIALAFVAGFSVEILFSILDGLIRAFRSFSPQSEAAAAVRVAPGALG